MKFSTKLNLKNRRNFLFGLAGTFSSLMFWKYSRLVEKKEKPVKMLTEDGKLVEVDPRYFGGSRRSIKPDEIHTWVKTKNTKK